MQRIKISRIVAVSIAAVALALALPCARATTFTISSTADDGSAGTLRVALESATDGDTIDATGVSGTITLLSGELVVSNSVTILGPGPAHLAVDGNAASRVFLVTNVVTAAICSLTITNGNADGGGGIYNDHATLTVSNCILNGNSSQGVGLFGGFGGGIFNDGDLGGSASLEIVNITLSGNSAFVGGGIFNGGVQGSASLEIVNSTLSGNSASGNAADDGGGGIFNLGFVGSASVQIANSTLSGNSARGSGGGIFNDGGVGSASLEIANSTLSGNSASYGGGSIFNGGEFGSGTVEIGTTILNAGASGANITNSSGTVTSLGYNLSSDDGGGFLTGTADQINTDPMLGPLQNNGGPTFTHALLPGSPAIDKGFDFSGSTTDQRGAGFARTVDFPAILNASGGDGTDIGAFEVQAKCPLSHGFWKNNPNPWPVNSLVLGNQTYSKTELLNLLKTASTGDASLILARQLIAAKLNVANGSGPTSVSATITDADSLLSGFSGKLPYKVKTSSAVGKAMLNDATVLDNYNNDLLTPVCTP